MTSSPRRLRVSTANSAFQVLESLVGNRAKRHRARAFVVEGVQPITRALDHGWAFDAVIHQAGTRLSDWARDVVSRARPDIEYEMAAELMARLSARADGSELLAVVGMRDQTLAQIAAGPRLLAVVMDRPVNPGNLGTLIRSCDAFGADAVVVTGHGVDVYDPATVTASRGSLFALPVVQAASHAEVLEWVAGVRERIGRCQLIGADERGEREVAGCDLTSPTVLAFGNETHGLSRAYREACEALVRIPMSGSATSLNVSVAASIVLYEAVRQRRAS